MLDLALDESLKKVLGMCDDRYLREELVLGIQWDTGSKPKDGLIADIEERLLLIMEIVRVLTLIIHERHSVHFCGILLIS